MAAALYFTPELHLKDGRIIRHIDDALSFAREQEVRPGIDLCAGWKSWTCWNEDHPQTANAPARRKPHP
jgi:hypothetical protein